MGGKPIGFSSTSLSPAGGGRKRRQGSTSTLVHLHPMARKLEAGGIEFDSHPKQNRRF
jgi:hypothetical protein